MKAYDKFNSLDKQLTKLLVGNLLVHKFYNDRYPLVLIVRPDKDPEAQMTMMAADDGASSPDASLAFSLDADGLRMKINGRLLIDESLMNKIKNLVKKLVTAYLFGQFAERFTKNGDDIHYTGTPDDEDTPTPADADPVDEDDTDEAASDVIPDVEDTEKTDALADAAESDPFAAFFGDDAPSEAADNADAE